jgi:predicted DNA-binding mobile mystery protein A
LQSVDFSGFSQYVYPVTADRAQARRKLDDRFARLRPLAHEPTPHLGWIRAIRDALGMSSADLAARMGVIQQNIFDLERSEAHDTIKLATLRRTADALDCDLVYALVPRRTLAESVQTRARLQAAAHIAMVAHHSRLEDQSVTDADTDALLDELAATFIDRRGLWADDPSST